MKPKHEKQQVQSPDAGKEDGDNQRLHSGPLNDPYYPPRAGINSPVEMTYAEAMAKKKRGELTKPVLTEEGWVTAV